MYYSDLLEKVFGCWWIGLKGFIREKEVEVISEMARTGEDPENSRLGEHVL